MTDEQGGVKNRADEEQDVPAVADAVAGVREGIGSVRELLAQLIPEVETTTITDVYGLEHKCRMLVPARAQTQVARALERVFGTAAEGEDLAAMVSAAVRAADEETVDLLARAFEAAQPGAVKVARAKAQAEDPSVDGVPDAADLFPLEEIVLGLLPFVKRAIDRVLQAVAEPTETTSGN